MECLAFFEELTHYPFHHVIVANILRVNLTQFSEEIEAYSPKEDFVVRVVKILLKNFGAQVSKTLDIAVYSTFLLSILRQYFELVFKQLEEELACFFNDSFLGELVNYHRTVTLICQIRSTLEDLIK